MEHITILPKFLISGQDPQSQISYLINELNLLWVPNFMALEIYFIFGTKFSWNEVIDTCFNVEYVSLGRNFHFLDGYFVVTAPYCLLPSGYCSFPLLIWTKNNDWRLPSMQLVVSIKFIYININFIYIYIYIYIYI